MKKILIISFILVSLYFINYSQLQTDITTIQYQFGQWRNDFAKTYYSQAELEYRFNIFTQNLVMIQQHNSQKDVTYQMGLNQFADLTSEEFISIYLTQGANDVEEIQSTHEIIYQSNEDQLKSLPNSVDWRGITEMKDQGSCGAGWAFSVVGTLEAYQLLRKAEQVLLSEQNLIDCDNQSKGCDSGNNVNGYRYLQNYGTNLSSKYEYTGVKGVCRLSIGPYNISGYGFIVGEYGLKQALNNYPVSAGVDAQKWQFYKSGIYSDCGLTWNHYIMVVGYEDDGTWIVKNSWGLTWGEAGHIRLKSGNTCGVLSQAYQNK